MPMTTSERKQLLQELGRLQLDVPEVEVRVDLLTENLAAAQARVDEIERMLRADLVVRTPKADLGE